MKVFRKLMTNMRVLILLTAIILSLVAISPNPYNEGVTIRSISANSSAAIAGMSSPNAITRPMSRERIISINNKAVSSVADYYDVIDKLTPNSTLRIKTNVKEYALIVIPLLNTTLLNETETITFTQEIFDNASNKTVNTTQKIEQPKHITEIVGIKEIGIDVYEAPTSNIKKGLDLQGGTRILLEPQDPLSADNMSFLIDNMKERLNVYGLSDIVISDSEDLPEILGGTGKQYIIVEIAGATKQEVSDLIAKQGKFEAKVGNETAFIGGKDITYVCRSRDCSGINQQAGCRQGGNGWNCGFSFSISLTPEAADKHAAITNNLEIVPGTGGNDYLSEQLVLFLDDAEVDRLNIGASLQGKAETNILISGPGYGRSLEEARSDALLNMKKLQTMLQTGSLPVKLNVVNLESVSPTLGFEFVQNAVKVALIAILSVSFVIFLRYRSFKITIPLILTTFIEVILLLGMAAFIGWNIDLAGIAGIIIAIGTSLDHLIIITDQIRTKEVIASYDWKKRVKAGFEIIFTSYATTCVAMIPLWFAGAGLLRGFAIITIIGLTLGVFITRPAYAVVAEALLRD